VEVLERHSSAFRDDVSSGAALSMALFRQAQVRGERGTETAIAEACAILTRALAIDRELMQRAPDVPGVRRRLASDLAQYAEWLGIGGDHEAALASYEEVLALTEEDRARDPSDALARRHVAVVRIRTATTLLELDRADEARALVAPAVEELAAMVAADPGNIMIELSLADASLRLGQSLERLAGSIAGGAETPESLRQLARRHVAAAVERLTPLVEEGALTGTDAALLDLARRELAALDSR
jgi:tetratricopeptide (TPR) repeat protein